MKPLIKDTPKEDKPPVKDKPKVLSYTHSNRKSPLKEDNLSTKDKMAGPESVLIKRFHCTYLMLHLPSCHNHHAREKLSHLPQYTCHSDADCPEPVLHNTMKPLTEDTLTDNKPPNKARKEQAKIHTTL